MIKDFQHRYTQRMLKELLTDGVNRVEIYLTPTQSSLTQDGIFQVHQLGWDSLHKLKVLGAPFETTAYELVSEDITYSYDLPTDNQRATRKIWKTDRTHPHLYGIGFQEEVLPCHRFPSTKDIATAQTVERKQYRINNRTHWIVEKTKDQPAILYMSYYHSPNVDLDKMERDVNYHLKKMKHTLYPRY